SANRRPRTPARTAGSDHASRQAPQRFELSPNRDQGKIESAVTNAKPAIARPSPRRRGTEGMAGNGGASSTTDARHSGPITRPLTGTAQATQSQRPQSSHAAMPASPG